MDTTQETLKLLKYYVRKSQQATIHFDRFAAFVRKYVEKYIDSKPELAAFKDGTSSVLTSELESLASEGKCNLEYEDVDIKKIYFPEYFVEYIDEEYKKIAQTPEIPFPDHASLGIKIPDKIINSVDVKNDFVSWLEYEAFSKPLVIRFDFPEGIRNMMLTSNIFFNNLMNLCLDKFRLYLTSRRNVNYVHNKMGAMFSYNQAYIKKMLDDVITQQSKAKESIVKPTDFTYRFWTSLANLILQEYKSKTNKLPEEHSFSQVAYLVGYYSAYYKSIVQKEKSVKDGFKRFDQLMKKEPYIFTIQDIHNFRDEKGVALTKRYTREQLHKHLEEKIHSEDKSTLPEIVRIKSLDRREYFIHKSMILPIVMKKIREASETLRKQYLDEWVDLMKRFKKTEAMFDDNHFLTDVSGRVKNYDPLLWAMLRFDLLYRAYSENTAKHEMRQEVAGFFDTSKRDLVSVTHILGLDRETLLNEAKMYLPFWQTIPIISSLIIFAKRLFSRKQPKSGRKKKKQKQPEAAKVSKVMQDEAGSYEPERTAREEASATSRGETTTKAQLIEYRKQIDALKKQFLESGKSVDETLEELVERWNPIFEPTARANLVEDVNAMVRDYLRGLRRGFRVKPPDAQSIRQMAERLADNKAFNQIKRKEYFKRYIEIYMLKVLGKK
jgi:hypothetical protein